MKPTILFTHIQKTAGTTMGRLLKAKYGFWPPTNLLKIDLALGLHYFHYHGEFPEARILALQKLDENQKQKIRLVQGHMSFGIHKYLSQPYQYITVVREPISRVLSQYHQIQQQSWFPYSDEIRSMPIEEFIEKRPIDALTNFQVKMLAGVNNGLPGDLSPYNCTPSNPLLLQQAERNIADHYLVVVTELFDESMLLMKRKLGWRNSYYIKSNVTKSRKQRENFNPSVIDIIKEYNALDIELYNKITEQVRTQIEAQGDSFQEELRVFRRKNERLNRLLYQPIDHLLKVGRKIHVAGNRRNIAQSAE